MSENTKIGLIGFFDILGYQNLLERNEPEIIAEEVLLILIDMKEKIQLSVMENLINSLDSENRDMARKDRNNIITAISNNILSMDWLVFSDTILLTLPIDQTSVHEQRLLPWMIFFAASKLVQKELFDAGLPARGAIDYGKYFIKESCFAGRTIVNAHKLCSQIELSACVLSKVAADELASIDKMVGQKTFDNDLIEYLVPMKDCEQHLLVLRVLPTIIKESNVHMSVLRAFWGNRKDIPQTARPKAINTEQWLEFLMSQGVVGLNPAGHANTKYES